MQSSGTRSKTSNLTPEQIDTLRAAFEFIDQNSDGTISKQDLRQTFESIGQSFNDKYIECMLQEVESSGEISFTNFMTQLSAELTQIPNKNEIEKALQIFSEDMEIDNCELRESLMICGMSLSDVDKVLHSFQMERMNGQQVFIGTEFLRFITS